MYFISYLISINILGLILCLVDKIKALNNWYRISEKTLLFVSVIGGCFGFMLGMLMFRHKTRKLKFKLVYVLSGLYFLVYLLIIYNLV